MEERFNVGVWIDSKQAVIVRLHNGNETVEKLESGLITRERIDGEGKQYTRMGSQYFTFEKTEEEKRKHQLDIYFKNIIEAIKNSDSIIIFGPAEAKTGLHKAMLNDKVLASKIMSVEAQDHLTDNQIAAKTREFYNIRKGK
jgi:stalled ribosome rescue protein Dom34